MLFAFGPWGYVFLKRLLGLRFGVEGLVGFYSVWPSLLLLSGQRGNYPKGPKDLIIIYLGP